MENMLKNFNWNILIAVAGVLTGIATIGMGNTTEGIGIILASLVGSKK